MNKTKKIFALVLLVILTTTLLSACWDVVELDNIAIVSAIGLDKATDGQINVSMQIGNISQLSSKSESNGQSSGNPFTIYSGVDKTFPAAMSRINTKVSRNVFLHHNQVLVFGRELANYGLKDFMDGLLRQNGLRLDILTAMADSDAKDILSATVMPEKLSGISLNKLIARTKEDFPAFAPTFFDFLSEFTHPHCCPVLPLIKVVKDEEGAMQFEYEKLAVFKNLKLFTEIENPHIINGFAMLNKHTTHRNISTQTEQGQADFDLKNLKCTVKFVFDKQVPKAEISLKTDAQLIAIEGYLKTNQELLIKYLEQELIKTLSYELEQTVNFVRENQADIFCWGRKIHQHNYKKWHKIKDEWPQILASLPYDIKVAAKIRNTNAISGGILKNYGKR